MSKNFVYVFAFAICFTSVAAQGAVQVGLSAFSPRATVESFEGFSAGPNSPLVVSDRYLLPGAVGTFDLGSGVSLTAPVPNMNDEVLLGDFAISALSTWGIPPNGTVLSAADVPTGSAFIALNTAASADLSFDALQRRVGALVTLSSGDVSIEAFDEIGNSLGSVSIPAVHVSSWPANFLGIEDPNGGIARVRFTGAFAAIDDLTFEGSRCVVMDFESLAQAGSGAQTVGTSYSEDGYTINNQSLGSWQLGAPSFAGSTGLAANDVGATIELVRDGGGRFALRSIDLAPALFPFNGFATEVTFTGFRDGMAVATQMFTTPAAQPFATYVFNDDFGAVDRVTWTQDAVLGMVDGHQFDNIVVCPVCETVLETATLGPAGPGSGTGISSQFLGARFELTEHTRIKEIGGHLSVLSGGTIWGAIIAMPGPTTFPPPGFDFEANALAHAIFDAPSNMSVDITRPVDVFLPPGDYALLFGGDGLFGTTGSGAAPGNDPDIGSPTYLLNLGDQWFEGITSDTRFVVRGFRLPCPSRCVGDADGSGVVDFGDVTSALANWLTVCDPSALLAETAMLGPTGQLSGSLLGMSQYLGTRFEITELTRITGIGGHLAVDGGGTAWGAIIPLSGPGALPPNGLDIEASALVNALFTTASATSEDVLAPVDVILDPGTYGILMGGTGLFGATATGTMPTNNPEIGTPSYFITPNGGANWFNGGLTQIRFVVEGEPYPCNPFCAGDADGSGVVNFGDITSVLGNWLAICP